MPATLLQSDEIGLTDEDFRRVSQAVYKHCGITLNETKRDLVRARLAKEVRIGGHASPTAYLDHVLADAGGAAFTAFIDALSTNLTSFFRENDHFEYLGKTYLPELLAKKRAANDGRLLVWSAACSSGEEPYTLAMTIAEAIKARPMTVTGGWDVRILATDISTRVLQTAQAGMYPEGRMAGVPVGLRDKYFELKDGGVAATAAGARGKLTRKRPASTQPPAYEVCGDLRRMIRFRHLNLMDRWPFTGPFDVIFCRNVMIYFDKPTQERLVGRMWDVLRDGGLLFTGHSESLSGLRHRFAHRKPAVYAKAA